MVSKSKSPIRSLLLSCTSFYLVIYISQFSQLHSPDVVN